MNEIVGRRARRVLVVGALDDNPAFSTAAIAPDATVIVMENDPGRTGEVRRRLDADGLAGRATVIGGDPRRMLYKLAGPFDVIFCARAFLSARATIEKLLAADGALIVNDK